MMRFVGVRSQISTGAPLAACPPVRIAVLLLLVLSGCRRAESPISDTLPATGRQQVVRTKQAAPEQLDAKYLPNAYRIHDRVISGGQPDGEAAFKQLADLGVKTIVSVDGAKPDVALAKRHGLRYVHLPHGYDGISDDRAQDLSRAVRDLPGPIYIHCHHGKHRSPTAAAVACVGSGLIEPDTALNVLKTAGTSADYRGLYASAAAARRFADAELDALDYNFPESAELPPLAEAMVGIEHAHHRLIFLAAAGWNSPADHPDLDSPHEALLFREQFTELLRNDDVQQQPQHFRELLTQSEDLAVQLEAVLRMPAVSRDDDRAQATQVLQRISNNCTACHHEYRDVPLGEKIALTNINKE